MAYEDIFNRIRVTDTLTAGTLSATTLAATTATVTTVNAGIVVGTVDTVTDTGAISVASAITNIIVTGAGTKPVTLADGTAGQFKTIVATAVTTGVSRVTPTNLANGTTITFTAANAYTKLVFVGTQWYVIGGDATVA